MRPRADYDSPFAGSRFNRLTTDWIFSHMSADQEIQGSLFALRGRARELVRNVPYARKYVRHLANNVVGPRGITLQAKIPLRQTGNELNERLNDQVEGRWRTWGKKTTCSVDGRLSWRDVQRLALRTMATDGECFIRRVRGFDNAFGFALQLIDADLLDHTYDVPRGEDSNAIRMGVEIDRWGAPVAYHFWEAHPAEPAGRIRRRIPADQITHLYDVDRIAATRGVTWFVSVMLQLHMLHLYGEAELVASRIAAAKGGFFVRKNPDAAADFDAEDQDELTMEAEPGVLEELPPGVEFQGWDPQHPNSDFAEYVKAMLRSIASGLTISYTSIANDLENVNYSSIRAGLLDERDEWRDRQQFTIEHLVDDVYADWVAMAQLTNQLDARADSRTYFLVDWQPRGWDWVDPLKDAQGAEKEIELGINSRTRVAASKGRHLPDVLDELANEKRLAADKGVDIEPKKSGAGNTAQTEDDSDNADDGKSTARLGIA